MSFKQKNMNLLLISLFFLMLVKLSTSAVLIKAGNEMSFSCDKNVYYILVEVIFSAKPPKDLYPFTLNFAFPDKLNFKCMLDYPKSQINCFRAFSDDADYLEEDSYLQFPYPFPQIEDIEWDYESFLQKIYRKIINIGADCGKEDLFNVTNKNANNWKLEGKIANLQNGECQLSSKTKEEINKYTFDMSVSFESGEIIDLLKNENKKENETTEIELLQELWVPILPRKQKKAKEKSFQRVFPFAYCTSKENITIKNYDKFNLNCHIPIQSTTIFYGLLRISPFFDTLYVKAKDKISTISTYIKVDENKKKEQEENEKENENEKPFVSLDENDKGIICPNQPIFKINNKNDITMGLFYTESNRYTFFLTGTLFNGFQVLKNGTTVDLNETLKDINFNLVIEDNLMDSEENLKNVSCVLPRGSPFGIAGETIVKCIGAKENLSNQNKNVDILLNWDIKANNNFNDIIIKWPKTYDDLNIKNIYNYELTGLSIRQSNFGCHNNNFDFYVYIYDLRREPKLNFNLPLEYPKNYQANCEIFDQTALKCSLNLKHSKLKKGQKVMLPLMGTENEIINDGGNRIVFTMNNFSNINNDHDFYVKLEKSCGDYMVVGTLKDMGMSHETSVVVYILIIVFISIFIVGLILYISWKIKLRYKRGKKLTTSEETKDNNQSNTGAGL